MYLHEAFAKSKTVAREKYFNNPKEHWFLTDDIPAEIAIGNDWEPVIPVEKLILAEAAKKWNKFRSDHGVVGYFIYEDGLFKYVDKYGDKHYGVELSIRDITEPIWVEVKE